jgi:hypothetical protein
LSDNSVYVELNYCYTQSAKKEKKTAEKKQKNKKTKDVFKKNALQLIL